MTGPQKKSLTRPVDLPALVRTGDEIAQEEGTAGMLIGGAALQAYGLDRSTKDADFAVTQSHCIAIENRARAAGLPVRPLRIGGISIVTVHGTVDFIDRRYGPEGLFVEAIEAGRRAGTTLEADGASIRVVPLEYLVALKMVGARPQDDADLAFLLTKRELDYSQARDIVMRHLGETVARYLDRAARQAGRIDAPRDYLDDES